MSKYTRRATWDDLIYVINILKEYKVRFVVVGGYALKMYGYTRETFDIDIVVDTSSENSKNWILALSHLPDKAVEELIGEEDPFAGDYEHSIRINDEITVDIMPSVSGIQYSELEKHSNEVTIKGTKIPVLDIEGLLLSKKNSLRDKDQQDVKFLENVLLNINDNH